MKRILMSVCAVFVGCADNGDERAPDPVCGDRTCNAEETPASCPADCVATCGNGACDAGETTASCPADCPTAACTTQPDSCTGENICINSACVSAFGRNYIVRVSSGTFPERNASGDPWDEFVGVGGLPDPFVTFTINTQAQTTPYKDDTLMPVWGFASPPTLIPGGTVLRVDVYDEDTGTDTLAWTCNYNPLSAAVVRGGLVCAGAGPLAAGRVNMTFTPN